jgi:tetratricopeptide (TPR) repeat protein
MSDSNLDDTQKIKTSSSKYSDLEKTKLNSVDDTQPFNIKKPRLWRIILLGILLILLLGAAGGGLGYYSGIRQRLIREQEKTLTQAALQFQYGIQQMEAGNFALAQKHFEYVLQIYPDFPGLTEKYTEVMIQMAKASQVTLAPEATLIVDNRGAEALFNQAFQEVNSQQWATAMNTLEALRNADYTYRTLDVDGLYFITLRYRAIEKIVNEGDLEEGLYFLALLEQYAPLDHDSINYGNWARDYLTGSSYWEVNWEQVVFYFSRLYAAFPYMHDGTGWTATDRFMVGSEKYGDQLAAAGEHCAAIPYYRNVLNISALEHIQDKYDDSYLKCYPPTKTPKPTDMPAPPEATETPEATAEPTQEPTATAGN